MFLSSELRKRLEQEKRALTEKFEAAEAVLKVVRIHAAAGNRVCVGSHVCSAVTEG